MIPLADIDWTSIAVWLLSAIGSAIPGIIGWLKSHKTDAKVNAVAHAALPTDQATDIVGPPKTDPSQK